MEFVHRCPEPLPPNHIEGFFEIDESMKYFSNVFRVFLAKYSQVEYLLGLWQAFSRQKPSLLLRYERICLGLESDENDA